MGSVSTGTLLANIYVTTIQPALFGPGITGPWRPPQWQSTIKSFFILATDPTTGSQTAYVFDGILRAEHEERVVTTLNPVQTGAAISDHAYVVPPSLTVEVAMSDSMQSFTMGQWANAPSRSVSAYQTLIALEEALQPVSVQTPLRSYTNMMIELITADETKETLHSLKSQVTFRKIITTSAQVANSNSASANNVSPTSSIPQTTGQTLNGQVQGQNVPQSIQNQNNTQSGGPALASNLSTVPSVPAAGSWSSTNINSITSVVG